MAVILIFSVLMLLFGVYAVMCRSILRAAIGLAFSSACLATVFYAMGAELAAVFELSVCSGLVTVVFIAGVSLSRSPKMELQNEYRDVRRSRFLPVVLIAAGTALMIGAVLMGGDGLTLTVGQDSEVRELLWNTRQADIWGQIAAILCGGVAVTVLFREEKR